MIWINIILLLLIILYHRINIMLDLLSKCILYLLIKPMTFTKPLSKHLGLILFTFVNNDILSPSRPQVNGYPYEFFFILTTHTVLIIIHKFKIK